MDCASDRVIYEWDEKSGSLRTNVVNSDKFIAFAITNVKTNYLKIYEITSSCCILRDNK